MSSRFLNDVVVLDFTTRLPGPLCTYVLRSFGAHITKIENTAIGGDAFQSEAILDNAPHFLDWYQQLNQDKNIIEIDFEKDLEQIKKEIFKAHIILSPDSRFFDTFLKQFDLKNKAIVKLAGGKNEWRSLHDLNALALTKTFKYHLKETKAPPYLPFAGMNFGVYLATAAISMLRRVEKDQKGYSEVFYLKDITNLIFDVLHSEQTSSPGKFLHSGAFPCYQVYKTKDEKFLCLAAVEDKYWKNLQSVFKINLNLEDRFDTSGKITKILKKLFSNLDSYEINERLKDSSSCLTILEE